MFFWKDKNLRGQFELFDQILEGEYQNAFSILKKEFEGKDIPNDYYFLIAKLLRKTEKFENSLQIYKNLLTMTNNEVDISILNREIAKSLIGLGNMEEAVAILENILSKEDDRNIRRQLADILYNSGDYEDAAEHYKKLEENRMVAACYYHIALKYNIKERSFADYMTKAIKFRDNFRSAKMDLANHYFSLSKNGKGLDYLIDIVYEELPMSVEDIYYIREKFITFSSLSDFETIIQKKVKEGTNNPFYYLYLAEESYLNGNTAAAKEIIGRYLSQNISKSAIRYYFKYISDEVLSSLYSEEYFYSCSSCRASFKNFIPICSSCGGVDSLTFL
ncbi:MAG: tetratricopeptide repeat protein [Calditerrivibrio sp.]|nr:tetratricopeptide repeat protein [Calditerrivibrio sp.]